MMKEDDLELEQLIDKYKRIEERLDSKKNTAEKNMKIMSKEITEVLDPSQINTLLQKIAILPRKEGYPILMGCLFLNNLIQNSYNAGYNNFFLNPQGDILSELGSKIHGKKNNPLKINIEGNAGIFFGLESKNLVCNINGDAGYGFGLYSKNSAYDVNGDITDSFAVGSKNCRYNIHGNIEGINWASGLNIWFSRFSTPNKATYEKLRQEIKGLTNKVIYTREHKS